MIAAWVSAKALSIYMGHTTIGITLDRYGDLMPGHEDEAADMPDAYPARGSAPVLRRSYPDSVGFDHTHTGQTSHG
jgi:hypothetical protein